MHAIQSPVRPITSISPSLLRRDPMAPALSRVASISAADDPRGNHLLAALPESDWLAWSSQLELVEMPVGQVLSEPGRRFTHVHFPITSSVSLINLMVHTFCDPEMIVLLHHSLSEPKLAQIIDTIFAGLGRQADRKDKGATALRLEVVASR